MTRWIALLRGINVGGKNILPMKDLRALLETLGYGHVRTYIQSGNCVFDAHAVDADSIAGAITARFGFRPNVIVMPAETLQSVLDRTPFPQAASDPKSLHLYFLSEPATSADMAGIEALRGATEDYRLTDQVFYLYAPDGIGRSKLAAKVERLLGVPATARNLRSAMAIAALAGD